MRLDVCRSPIVALSCYCCCAVISPCPDIASSSMLYCLCIVQGGKHVDPMEGFIQGPDGRYYPADENGQPVFEDPLEVGKAVSAY